MSRLEADGAMLEVDDENATVRLVDVSVDGTAVRVATGTSVAAAVAVAGTTSFRRSPTAMPRGPVCGMGICFECRLEVDGRPGVRSCMTVVSDGMRVRTTDA